MSDKDELPTTIFLRAYDSATWREAIEKRAVDWNDQPDERATLNAEYVRGDSLNEWISVDERLPEKHQAVLIFDGEEMIVCTCYRLGGHGSLVWERPNDFSEWENRQDYFATHWMPLPEVPK